MWECRARNSPGTYILHAESPVRQHLKGIKDASIIVAINKNANAPIFKNCDYGIVGDVMEILPLLTAALDNGEAKQPAPPMIKMKRPQLPKEKPIGKTYVCGAADMNIIRRKVILTMTSLPELCLKNFRKTGYARNVLKEKICLSRRKLKGGSLMYCVRNVTEDLYWVGANDHRLALFENIHPIPRGVSYNAYLLLDEKSVLFDTVDWSACRQLLENMDYLLEGKPLDYLVINHMEPDHGALSRKSFCVIRR